MGCWSAQDAIDRARSAIVNDVSSRANEYRSTMTDSLRIVDALGHDSVAEAAQSMAVNRTVSAEMAQFV